MSWRFPTNNKSVWLVVGFLSIVAAAFIIALAVVVSTPMQQENVFFSVGGGSISSGSGSAPKKPSSSAENPPYILAEVTPTNKVQVFTPNTWSYKGPATLYVHRENNPGLTDYYYVPNVDTATSRTVTFNIDTNTPKITQVCFTTGTSTNNAEQTVCTTPFHGSGYMSSGYSGPSEQAASAVESTQGSF